MAPETLNQFYSSREDLAAIEASTFLVLSARLLSETASMVLLVMPRDSENEAVYLASGRLRKENHRMRSAHVVMM